MAWDLHEEVGKALPEVHECLMEALRRYRRGDKSVTTDHIIKIHKHFVDILHARMSDVLNPVQEAALKSRDGQVDIDSILAHIGDDEVKLRNLYELLQFEEGQRALRQASHGLPWGSN